ncbi:MAG TPA: phosphoserine phosphatase SerB [Nocardioides sp.]|uniref:phosphoserine phosphatase SerB n=1 Tax=uncultured Nocardioides sp. TaxID=198441 RepID=UPI0026225112|nr:phosphoserine phosphatase SerB [uncultured Nocardioides sp.]HRD60989.1 phosphoserine phosphatase SerB [Nocardioides sp.]HRI95263.1 phosphoserine phosphatase SerB [Nocardioides sp.]HRK45227.1 phosphoserine phosphatase SerB [Nocardioides sp.]
MNHHRRPRPETLLITLTGKDRPGVTSAIFTTLSRAGVEVVDVEQILLRRRLVLGVLVTIPRDWKKLRDAVEATARDLDMSVDIERGTGDNKSRRGGRSHVTVIGTPLKATHMAAVAGRIADTGANIDRIERMARYPVTAIDLHVSGIDTDTLRTTLAVEAAAQGIDIAVQPANLQRLGMRLIVMDVDSTFIQGEVIEMLAAHAGFRDEVAEITEAAMRGDLDFEASLRERVRLLKGVPEAAFDTVYDAIELSPGARTLVRILRRLGYRFALVSGGFSQITDRLAADLGIHFSRANVLEVIDGRLTGEIVGDVVDRAGKARALREFAAELGLSEASVIAIGDGANDLDMLNAAGLGIAYNAKPVVRDAVDTAVNVPYLDTILYLLGISREEIEAADAAEGIVTPSPPI